MGCDTCSVLAFVLSLDPLRISFPIYFLIQLSHFPLPPSLSLFFLLHPAFFRRLWLACYQPRQEMMAPDDVRRNFWHSHFSIFLCGKRWGVGCRGKSFSLPPPPLFCLAQCMSYAAVREEKDSITRSPPTNPERISSPFPSPKASTLKNVSATDNVIMTTIPPRRVMRSRESFSFFSFPQTRVEKDGEWIYLLQHIVAVRGITSFATLIFFPSFFLHSLMHQASWLQSLSHIYLTLLFSPPFPPLFQRESCRQ